MSASVHAGIPPPREQTPLGADTPPGADPPSRHPPEQTPPWEQTPWSRHPPGTYTPPQEADASIRSMCGRYASYWNAFLFNHSIKVRFRSSVYHKYYFKIQKIRHKLSLKPMRLSLFLCEIQMPFISKRLF